MFTLFKVFRIIGITTDDSECGHFLRSDSYQRNLLNTFISGIRIIISSNIWGCNRNLLYQLFLKLLENKDKMHHERM